MTSDNDLLNTNYNLFQRIFPSLLKKYTNCQNYYRKNLLCLHSCMNRRFLKPWRFSDNRVRVVGSRMCVTTRSFTGVKRSSKKLGWCGGHGVKWNDPERNSVRREACMSEYKVVASDSCTGNARLRGRRFRKN